MATKNEYFPQTVHHPGETLKEKLEEMQMSQIEFSIRTGISEQVIFGIINTKSAITAEIAALFEGVLQIPAHFWMNRQRSYDECLAKNNENKKNNKNIKQIRKKAILILDEDKH